MNTAGNQNFHKVVIIGAGPGGLCMAIKLLQAGIDDFAILEKASGLGGTWYNNIFPGLCCDVPSHLYSFSFEPKRDWTQPYPAQPEILEYLQGVAAKYKIEPYIQFDTRVTEARWSDETSSWTLATDRGEIRARVVVSAMGMFNNLKLPDIPGLDGFAGSLFHTSRWDRDHDLTGRTVAVIGAAATAVQMAPEVAKLAKRLYLFQRSASWVLPKENDPFSEEQIAHFVDDPDAARIERETIYQRIDGGLLFSDPEMRRAAEQAGLANLAQVEDPEVRRKLTPSVPWGCHRPLSTNDWFPMFNRPNVELVTEPIANITHDAIVCADGKSRRVDTIVAATGFDVTRYLSAIRVTGRGGLRLEDAWNDGPEAYLGIATTGFPNIFMLYGPNTNNGSILTLLEYQVAYVIRMLEHMEREGIAWMDVRRDAMDRYNELIQRELDGVEVWNVSCHNYYRTPSGRIVTQWPNTMSEYRRRTRKLDDTAYEIGIAQGL